MSAASLTAVPAHYRTPFVLSAAAHVALLLALSSGFIVLPSQPLQQLAIEAVLVDQGAIQRAVEQERQEDLADQRRRDAALERQRDAEQQRVQRDRDMAQAEKTRVAAERQKQAADQKAADQKRREADAKTAAERKRKETEAAAKRAEQQRVVEAQAKAAAEQREQLRRQAELAAVMAAEEDLLAAKQSGAQSRWVALIQQRVQRKWQQPASAVAGVECEVSVQQLPNGDVTTARVTRCNADEAVRRSVENAVYAASPLPLPDDRRLFERNLIFVFKPELQD
jgi:colicin import membrane protein